MQFFSGENFMDYNPLNLIKKIRKTCDKPNIRVDNGNEYRMQVWEDDGSLTAYYFSCPIYDLENRRLLSFVISQGEDGFVAKGINSQISYCKNKIVIKQFNDEFVIEFDKQSNLSLCDESQLGLQRKAVSYGKFRAIPANNGFAIEGDKGAETEFLIRVPRIYEKIMENDGYITFMKDEFMPHLGISALWCKDENSNIVPPRLKYSKISDTIYRVSIELYSCVADEKFSFSLEINVYASKFIFDTTIDSANPDKNNAYGGVAYLGYTKQYGEQWLYSRLNPSLLIDLSYFSVSEANLLLPIFGSSGNIVLETHKMTTTWCSFGSTWNTKIVPDKLLGETILEGDYKTRQ